MTRRRVVCATEQYGDKEHLAEYEVDSGNLRILVNGVTVHALQPPDSWVAIASVSTGNEWGTDPSAKDLRSLLANSPFCDSPSFVKPWGLDRIPRVLPAK